MTFDDVINKYKSQAAGGDVVDSYQEDNEHAGNSILKNKTSSNTDTGTGTVGNKDAMSFDDVIAKYKTGNGNQGSSSVSVPADESDEMSPSELADKGIISRDQEKAAKDGGLNWMDTMRYQQQAESGIEEAEGGFRGAMATLNRFANGIIPGWAAGQKANISTSQNALQKILEGNFKSNSELNGLVKAASVSGDGFGDVVDQIDETIRNGYGKGARKVVYSKDENGKAHRSFGDEYTAQERQDMRISMIQDAAENFLRNRADVKRESAAMAGIAKENESGFGTAARGLTQNVGYMAAMVNAPLAIATSAIGRTADLTKDNIDLDDDGNLVITSRDEFGVKTVAKATTGAAFEFAVEKYLGKLTGKIGEKIGLGKIKGAIGNAASSLIRKASPKAFDAISRFFRYNAKIGEKFALNDLPTEIAEEYVQGFADEAKIIGLGGLSLSSTENAKSALAYTSDFLDWDKNLKELLITTVAMQVVGGSVSAASQISHDRKLARSVDAELKDVYGASDDVISGHTLGEKMNAIVAQDIIDADRVAKANGKESSETGFGRYMVNKNTGKIASANSVLAASRAGIGFNFDEWSECDKFGRTIDEALAECGVSSQYAKTMSNDDKIKVFRSLAEIGMMNNKQKEDLLGMCSSYMRDIANKMAMVNNFGANINVDGYESKFKGNGFWIKSEDGKSERLFDPESGISIVHKFGADGEDDVYSVIASGYPKSIDASTANGALHAANWMSMAAQAHADEIKKRESYLDERMKILAPNQSYAAWANPEALINDTELKKTEEGRRIIEDCKEAISKGNGSLGAFNTQTTDKNGNKVGFTAFFLNNISSPAEMNRTIVHETNVHAGLLEMIKDPAIRRDLIERVGKDNPKLKSMLEGLKNGSYSDVNDEAEIIEEAIAWYSERGIRDLGIRDKIGKWFRGNPQFSAYTAKDIDAMLADMRDKVRSRRSVSSMKRDFARENEEAAASPADNASDGTTADNTADTTQPSTQYANTDDTTKTNTENSEEHSVAGLKEINDSTAVRGESTEEKTPANSIIKQKTESSKEEKPDEPSENPLIKKQSGRGRKRKIADEPREGDLPNASEIEAATPEQIEEYVENVLVPWQEGLRQKVIAAKKKLEKANGKNYQRSKEAAEKNLKLAQWRNRNAQRIVDEFENAVARKRGEEEVEVTDPGERPSDASETGDAGNGIIKKKDVSETSDQVPAKAAINVTEEGRAAGRETQKKNADLKAAKRMLIEQGVLKTNPTIANNKSALKKCIDIVYEIANVIDGISSGAKLSNSFVGEMTDRTFTSMLRKIEDRIWVESSRNGIIRRKDDGTPVSKIGNQDLITLFKGVNEGGFILDYINSKTSMSDEGKKKMCDLVQGLINREIARRFIETIDSKLQGKNKGGINNTNSIEDAVLAIDGGIRIPLFSNGKLSGFQELDARGLQDRLISMYGANAGETTDDDRIAFADFLHDAYSLVDKIKMTNDERIKMQNDDARHSSSKSAAFADGNLTVKTESELVGDEDADGDSVGEEDDVSPRKKLSSASSNNSGEADEFAGVYDGIDINRLSKMNSDDLGDAFIVAYNNASRIGESRGLKGEELDSFIQRATQNITEIAKNKAKADIEISRSETRRNEEKEKAKENSKGEEDLEDEEVEEADFSENNAGNRFLRASVRARMYGSDRAFLDDYGKVLYNKKVDNKKLERLTKGVFDGSVRFKQFSVFERSASPESNLSSERDGILVGAAIISGREAGADPSAVEGFRTFSDFQKAERRIGQSQELAIEQWAKSNGIWHGNTESFLSGKYGEILAEGGESHVYDAGENVVKSIGLDYFISPQKLFDRIMLHNAMFPATRMDVVGFGKGEDGEFRVIVSQPFVKNGERLTNDEIDRFLESIGFEKTNDQSRTFETDEIYLSDMHDENLIRTPDGNILVIDSDIRVNDPVVMPRGASRKGVMESEYGLEYKGASGKESERQAIEGSMFRLGSEDSRVRARMVGYSGALAMDNEDAKNGRAPGEGSYVPYNRVRDSNTGETHRTKEAEELIRESGIDVGANSIFNVHDASEFTDVRARVSNSDWAAANAAADTASLSDNDKRALGIPTPSPVPPASSSVEEAMRKAETLGQKIIRKFQDHLRDLLDLESAAGIAKNSNASVYGAFDRSHGMMEYWNKRLNDEFLHPIAEKIKNSGLNLKTVNEYLYAMHGKERNAEIAYKTRNDAKPTLDGSGHTNAYWDTRLAEFARSPKIADLKKIADMVYKMNEQTRKRLVRGGIISSKEADEWRRLSPHYVPLRNDGPEFSKRFGMHAVGRTTDAESPLAGSIMQAQQSIKSYNDNEVRKKLASLVASNADAGEVVDKLPEGKHYDESTGQIVGDGEKANPKNVVSFRDGGKTRYVVMYGDKGRRIAQALTNRSLVENGQIMRYVQAASRKFAQMRTTFSPEFVVSNALKDNAQAAFMIGSRYGKGAVANFEKCVVGAAKAANLIFRGKDTSHGNEIERFADEWAKNGGMIGGIVVEGLDSLDMRMEREAIKFEDSNILGKGKKTIEAIEGAYEAINAPIELGTRLAMYVAARKSGADVNEAVAFSRDATANFNRKGELTPFFNSFWVFSNAAIQDMAVTLPVFRDAFTKGGKPLASVSALFGAGLLASMINNSGDDDDEPGKPSYANETEWSKENNLMLIAGDKKLMLPQNGPKRMAMYLGTVVGDTIFGKKGTAEERAQMAAVNAAKFALSNFLDMTGSAAALNGVEEGANFSGLASNLAPTLARPMIELGTNKDYAGRPIYQKQYDDSAPLSESGYRSTGEGWKSIAKFLNRITGGNENRKGYVDLAPEQLRYFASYLGGGQMTTLGRLADSLQQSTGNEHVSLRNVPFLNRVLRETADSTSKYHEARNEFAKLEYEVSKTDWSDEGNVGRGREIISKYPFAADDNMMKALKNTPDLIKKLQEIERDSELTLDQRDMATAYRRAIQDDYATIISGNDKDGESANRFIRKYNPDITQSSREKRQSRRAR